MADVSDTQGIDLNRIKAAFTSAELALDKDVTEVKDEVLKEFVALKADVHELIDHVEADGLLGRVSAARQSLATDSDTPTST